MDIMDRMDAMDLPFDGRMDWRKKLSPAVSVHSVHKKCVHFCPWCPFRPFLSLSLVHKKCTKTRFQFADRRKWDYYL
jgi:hypothetical protein